MNIGNTIVNAFEQAVREGEASTGRGTVGARNRQRSQRFVTILARSIRDGCRGSDVEVMSMHLHEDDEVESRRVRKQFGMQELLYDIVVFRKGHYRGDHGEPMPFVAEGLWLVESELAKNGRQALYDFNKLVLGRAAHKLFIGPRVADRRRQAYLDMLKAVASASRDDLYLALVPHPRDWGSPNGHCLDVLHFSNGEWRDVIRTATQR